MLNKWGLIVINEMITSDFDVLSSSELESSASTGFLTSESGLGLSVLLTGFSLTTFFSA